MFLDWTKSLATPMLVLKASRSFMQCCDMMTLPPGKVLGSSTVPQVLRSKPLKEKSCQRGEVNEVRWVIGPYCRVAALISRFSA